ncbi:MAG: GntR family transcriptional regulator [Candidatus Izemoplasmatales bacterium]|uniref:GntR family transcriptional regulator n=1 Tax=Hujiaoplasma nucleasis TaxID=2725268 RepID=A0A7L6N6W3_9MOLU|nr:GntR family transcriptional regulator [Hujiaoplasma nucleasis]QLY40735.1 GntR family transcriptional regulator [Hujiaoplasma nucleasis]
MKALRINFQSSKPIYQQLYDQIASQIINQDLVKDTKLPSIRTAAKELRVSIITIKKTWEMLENDNFIYTIAGKGAYVQDIKPSKLSIKKDVVIEDDVDDIIKRCKSIGITKSELVELINKKYK